ncbi:MAG TPA: peptidylprolyl isomerase [Pyrinomonadaceae bacterium]|nr:peptidylprolyl isomerase [Pyrinomonadaceae bacterium]
MLTFLCTAFSGASLAQQPATPSPTRQEEAPAPRKLNARPANASTSPAEPFDNATVAKMAAQCVKLETALGDIEMEMLAEAAPETVRNFLNLVAIRAFDTTTFSRVVKGFVIQGGNLSTRATLTPQLAARMRRTIFDEPNYIKHVPGVVSMARPAQDNSATTNFFILAGEATHLDGKFAAFGRVVRGMEVVEAINLAPAEGEKPDKPVLLKRASIAPCAPISEKKPNP